MAYRGETELDISNLLIEAEANLRECHKQVPYQKLYATCLRNSSQRYMDLCEQLNRQIPSTEPAIILAYYQEEVSKKYPYLYSFFIANLMLKHRSAQNIHWIIYNHLDQFCFNFKKQTTYLSMQHFSFMLHFLYAGANDALTDGRVNHETIKTIIIQTKQFLHELIKDHLGAFYDPFACPESTIKTIQTYYYKLFMLSSIMNESVAPELLQFIREDADINAYKNQPLNFFENLGGSEKTLIITTVFNNINNYTILAAYLLNEYLFTKINLNDKLQFLQTIFKDKHPEIYAEIATPKRSSELTWKEIKKILSLILSEKDDCLYTNNVMFYAALKIAITNNTSQLFDLNKINRFLNKQYLKNQYQLMLKNLVDISMNEVLAHTPTGRGKINLVLAIIILLAAYISTPLAVIVASITAVNLYSSIIYKWWYRKTLERTSMSFKNLRETTIRSITRIRLALLINKVAVDRDLENHLLKKAILCQNDTSNSMSDSLNNLFREQLATITDPAVLDDAEVLLPDTITPGILNSRSTLSAYITACAQNPEYRKHGVNENQLLSLLQTQQDLIKAPGIAPKSA